MINKVVVHPSVLFTVVNNLERRKPEDQDNSGIIIGQASKGIVYLKYAYPVKYEMLNGVLQIESESIKPLLDLHRRVHPGHIIVGWYTKKIDNPTYLINKYLPKEIPSLVYLRVNVSDNDLGIETFVRQ
ncbi:Eukaryotic translation initiation factor 3 subunit F [Thelohanellus kitauei]|uniref:Eukaryotic translation initiation factor 3 subunit F n=1 Tax=Thelohanellus kitauei TaxID=669202 RepID=A0A0C2IJX8_THEKT|nr:Eukaryotic translation initiation factor 3 subunit F [Thelohanellus kitauei]